VKPFYSIDELADLLGRDEIEVADGLKANSTPMIYNGDVADLSEWYGRRARRGGNGSVIIRAVGTPLPSSLDVTGSRWPKIASCVRERCWYESVRGIAIAFDPRA
jgi:hypothetical protein